MPHRVTSPEPLRSSSLGRRTIHDRRSASRKPTRRSPIQTCRASSGPNTRVSHGRGYRHAMSADTTASPRPEPTAAARDGGTPFTSAQAALTDALRAEYALLASMLASVWSASLTRVSLFLGVVSATGVALGFASQAGGGFGSTFTVFALVALPLVLFLG